MSCHIGLALARALAHLCCLVHTVSQCIIIITGIVIIIIYILVSQLYIST